MMNKLHIPVVFGFMAMTLMFMVGASHAKAFAEHNVDRDSFAITDAGTAVYTFTILIGGWNKDLYLPVVGERGMAFATRENRFGFELESGFPQEVSEVGSVTALMTTDAIIENGYYKIPAKSLASVKIVALASVPEEDGNIYRLRITNLPFLSGPDKRPGHFSNGEIKYMVSNFEALHFERDFE